MVNSPLINNVSELDHNSTKIEETQGGLKRDCYNRPEASSSSSIRSKDFI